ncbi:MAG: hypothetical protein JAZ20_10830 [Candidatus Thiodiazotropha weberae]|nr:hypothetical protein [Candidatus Thiodiazotropha lotti]MCG8011417.1 hypothetical protein [Candidatus Thiodiazotropha lotti]MCG8020905.1 hypothetical protein [Candidatus Thiodiazotropha lotti]MCW4208071.1 hypothetical protein [Candidatus Thiodiazotropha lotti]MCW4210882.1 hypothetical protein [Candidatus Thiodiazotropha lotti]
MGFDEIDLEEERDRQTRDGMADVKVGSVFDHLAVRAWAESLDSNNPLPAPTTKKAAQEAASSKSNI